MPIASIDAAPVRLSPPRLALGFVLAPLVPALLISIPTLFDGAGSERYLRTVMLYAFIGGYPAALFIGVPALLVLKRWLRPRLVWAILVGGLVAATPWGLVMVLVAQPDNAWVGEYVTVQNGQRTLRGWIEAGKLVALVFGLGAVGGLAFWLVGIFQLKPPLDPPTHSMR